MPSKRPARQLCPLCTYDDTVEVFLSGETWQMTCTASTHPPYTWTPREPTDRCRFGPDGVGGELGVYDDLLACAEEGFSEYGVIEYRYWIRNPTAYRKLVGMYGHTAIEGTQYSASAFLARALSLLARKGLVYDRWVPATGRWQYNGTTGGYGPVGTTEDDTCLSWGQFATETLKVSPGDWPPLAN